MSDYFYASSMGPSTASLLFWLCIQYMIKLLEQGVMKGMKHI